MIQEATDTNTSSIRLEELAHTSIELARLVATNLAAPPELLTELASSSDEIIRQNVTANPNTPTEVLFKLCEEFSEQFIDNPICSLLFLENPNLVQQMPWEPLMILLKYESTPLSFLSSFLQFSNERFTNCIQQAVRLHINWSGEICTNVNEVVWTEIHNTHLYYGAADGTFDGLWIEAESYAKRISIPEFIIQQLSKHSCMEIKCIVAQHPNTSAHVLEWLLQYDDDSNDYEYCRRIAKNPNTPVHLLEELAEHGDYDTYINVAKNPNTPVHLLEELAQDNDWGARCNVAANPNTPAHILELLAQDENSNVRSSVTKNPNIPVTLIEKLVQNEESILLSCIAKNPNTPIYNLGRGRYACDVINSIAANPNTPVHFLEKWAQDENSHFHSGVAKNPNTPVHILELLAQDEDSDVRCNVAANPNIPAHILELLAQDEDSDVRCNVAANPNIPAHILELLAQDEDDDEDDNVFDHLARNPNIPLHYLLKFNRGLLTCISEDTCCHSFIRFLILLSPDTPSEALATNSNSLDWVERFAITQNPNVTMDVLQKLAKDGNRIVRAAAKANLERGNGKSDILHHNQ